MSEPTRRSFLKKAGLLAGLAMLSPKDLIKELDTLSKHVSKHGQSVYAQEIARFFKCKVIEVDFHKFPNTPELSPYLSNYNASKHVSYSIKSDWPQKRVIEGCLIPAMMAMKRQMEIDESEGGKILPTIVFRQWYDIKLDEEKHSIMYYLI